MTSQISYDALTYIRSKYGGISRLINDANIIILLGNLRIGDKHDGSINDGNQSETVLIPN